MSAELKDLRCKISAEADCAIEAEARSTGRDKCEVVREILDAWAGKKIHAATVLDRLLRSEGIAGIAGANPIESRLGKPLK